MSVAFKETRNSLVLQSFVAYCKAHPTERFWQALRNWCGHNFVLVSKKGADQNVYSLDTFYWEGKDK